jgi:hypothetical protein
MLFAVYLLVFLPLETCPNSFPGLGSRTGVSTLRAGGLILICGMRNLSRALIQTEPRPRRFPARDTQPGSEGNRWDAALQHA